MRVKTLSQIVLALLFVLAGTNHFWHAEFYRAIMPPYLPWQRELVLISGIAEVMLGMLLLIPRWTRWAAWGLIALLVAVFPANVHMALHPELFRWASPIVLWLRLPLQLVLIGWVYGHTLSEKLPLAHTLAALQPLADGHRVDDADDRQSESR